MKEQLKALLKKFGPELVARAKAHLASRDPWEYASLATVGAILVMLAVSVYGYFYP